jgi:phosphoribosylformylglycinamidine synthase
VTGAPVGIDLDAEAELQHAMLELARKKLLKSAHDVSDGGFAVTLAESCIAHGYGARVSLPSSEDAPAHALLFSEEPTRVLVSLSPSKVGAVGDICARYGVPFEKIGTVTGQTVAIEGVCEVPVEELAESHASALDAIVS